MAQLYKLIKPLIFLLPPELAHHLGLAVVRIIGFLHRHGIWQRSQWSRDRRLETQTPFGRLDSPLGLAAGFDKNAKALWGWQALGFGFVEIGTVTPVGQPGNEKPRLFRFPRWQALVNRLGFNNEGAQAISARLKEAKQQGLKIKVGGNIGKNFSTPLENAAMDYRRAAMQIQAYVDYLVINVSSPNTPGLRDMQGEIFLDNIVAGVRHEAPDKPIFIKVAPDNFETFQQGVLHVVEKYKLAGVICGNTLANHAASSLKEKEVISLPKGGLSGGPVFENNLNLAKSYVGELPFVIGVGGITTPSKAHQYLQSGCKLIQIYTGFIYQGPGFIKEILVKLLHESV